MGQWWLPFHEIDDEKLRDTIIEYGVHPLKIVEELQKKEPYLKIEQDMLVHIENVSILSIEKLEEIQTRRDGQIHDNKLLVPITCKTVSRSILPF